MQADGLLEAALGLLWFPLQQVDVAQANQRGDAVGVDLQRREERLLGLGVPAGCRVQLAERGMNHVEVRVELQGLRAGSLGARDMAAVVGNGVKLDERLALAGVGRGIIRIDGQGGLVPAERALYAFDRNGQQ